MKNLYMIWFIKDKQDIGFLGREKGCIPRGVALTKMWKSKKSFDVYKEHQVAEFNCNDYIIIVVFLLKYAGILMVLFSQ